MNQLTKKTWMYFVLIAYLLSIFVLYLFNATIGTIGLYIAFTLVLFIVGVVIQKKLSEKEQETLKQQKIPLITNEQARDKLMEFMFEKGIMPRTILRSHTHIIKPESPQQTPSYFYYEVIQDRYSNEYYLLYINKKNIKDVGIERSIIDFKAEQIKLILENASESTREYVPIMKETRDALGNVVSIDTTYVKPFITAPQSKKEETIGE